MIFVLHFSETQRSVDFKKRPNRLGLLNHGCNFLKFMPILSNEINALLFVIYQRVTLQAMQVLAQIN